MKGSATQRREREIESALFAQPAPPALSGEPDLRVVDDLAMSPAVADAELEVIERHLRRMLHQVLFHEKSEAQRSRHPRGALCSGIHRPPG
jgi:hypothetical protein